MAGLQRLQDAFARLVDSPSERARSARARRILSGEGPRGARIYAEMYRRRLVAALREDFPLVEKLLGEEGFSALASAYAAAYPSDHFSLGRFGRAFETFLRERSALPRGDLADLAALEWARAEVFVERDAPVLDPSVLSELGGDVAGVRLAFVPALRLLTLGRDPLPLWTALEKGTEVPPQGEVPVRVLVWRKDLRAWHVLVSQEEFESLALSMRGATVAEACEPFGRLGASAPQAALAALASWFGEGLVSSVVR
jgi:Putative DNA-binding domain